MQPPNWGKRGAGGVPGTARLGGNVGEAPPSPQGSSVIPKPLPRSCDNSQVWPVKVGKKLPVEEEPPQKRRGSEDAF